MSLLLDSFWRALAYCLHPVTLLWSLLPLGLLVAALLAIHELNDSELISATAEVDAALLADVVPPDAYADPGFAEFLNQPFPAPGGTEASR